DGAAQPAERHRVPGGRGLGTARHRGRHVGRVRDGRARRGAHRNAALSGAAALILAGTVGLDGGLILRRWLAADIGAGLFVLSVVAATGRLAAVALPGRGIISTALVILLVALGVRYLPAPARRGPQLAGALAAGTTAVIILARAFDGITASVRAATPFWKADIVGYPGRVAEATGPDAWQLAVAVLIIT